MMINGAIATIGVTCRITAYGKNDSSIHLDWLNRTEMNTPSATASASAKNVICKVTHSELESVCQSLIKVCTTNNGPGRMKTGTWFRRTMASHSESMTTPMASGAS